MQSNNLNLEERYKKSEEYEEKLKQLRAKIGIKPDFIELRTICIIQLTPYTK